MSNELYHHGILGQKWGIRRYQNKDGTLTEAGKKRVEKQYKKAAAKAVEDYSNNRTDLWVKAYNKSADIANNGGIDKFNAEQEEKYGSDFAKREGYMSDYEAYFSKIFDEQWSMTKSEFIRSNKYQKEASDLVNKYSMEEWSEFARRNEQDLRDIIGG